MSQLTLILLVVAAASSPVFSFCFHAGGGVGEYHGTCSDSIGIERGPGAKNSWFQWLFCRHGGLLRALQLLDRLPRYGRTGGKIWPKWPGGQCQVVRWSFRWLGGYWSGGEVVGWLGDHSGGEEVRRAGGRLVTLPRKPDDLHYCASQHSLQITHEIDAWCFQDSCWCSHNQVLWAEQMHFECGPRYAEESFCQVSNLLCQYIV